MRNFRKCQKIPGFLGSPPAGLRIFIILLVIFYFFQGCRVANKSIFNANLSYHPVSNINWHDTTTYDFKFLDSIFIQKDILVLSESDHGDGSSMEAECKMLRYLIDSSRINSLYIESSWINVEAINRILYEGGISVIEKTFEYFESTELKYWKSNGFWDYLARKIIERRVHLYGFDLWAKADVVQHYYEDAKSFLTVRTYLESQSREMFYTGYIKSEVINSIFTDIHRYNNIQSGLSYKVYDLIHDFIQIVIGEYAIINNKVRIEEWKAVDNYFKWMSERTLVMKDNHKIHAFNNVPKDYKQFTAFHSFRDSILADNFFKYYARDRGKAVISVHSYHALLNGNKIDQFNECCKDVGVKPMMEYLEKKLENKIYNMCFINPLGRHGLIYLPTMIGQKYIKPHKQSLEYYLLKNYQGEYCMIDLQQPAVKQHSFYMRPIFHQYFNSVWSKNFSGIFYIKEMKPLNLMGN